MKKKLFLIFLIFLISIVGSGCGNKTNSNGVKGSDPNTNKSISTKDEENKNEKTQEIYVYYADVQVTKLEKHMQKISFIDDSQKYSAIYRTLQSSNQKELIPLWSKINLISANLKEGKLTLDIHIPDEARLGSGGEILAIDALKKTFFQFEEINSIELLIDGKETDSLMGHAELENPLTR